LGSGATGKVKLATNEKTGQKVAIKVINKKNLKAKQMEEEIKREIAIMKQLKHPNVVKLFEVLDSKENIYMVLELVTGGELFGKILSSEKFSEDQGRKFFQQIISGLDYCHKNGVAHRDLKPENLLVQGDDQLKISDFGLSAIIDRDDKNNLLNTSCGTLGYCAPEVVKDHAYDGFIADIWSSGIILYAMLTGMLPFKAEDTYYIAKTGKADFVFPSHLSAEAKRLLMRLMTPNPKKRITLAEVYEDEWFKVGFIKHDIQKVILDENDKDDKDFFVATEPVMETKEKVHEKKPINALELSSMFMNQEYMTNFKGSTFILPGKFKETMTRMDEILKEMKVKSDSKGTAFRVNQSGEDGMMSFHIELTPIVGEFVLVQCRKTRGSAFRFLECYQEFSHKCRTLKK
jgi:serine/threonine protein kinase